MNAPYSQCDAKGRCIRHPTIQMSRKKKLGGWKTLLSLCPMCAMELMSNDETWGRGSTSAVDNRAYCGDVAAPSSRGATGGMEPPASSSSRHSGHSSRHTSSRRSARSHHQDGDDNRSVDNHTVRSSQPYHGDDRSVDNNTVRSAPSTYRRRDSRDSQGSHPSVRKPASSSDSSCDSTVDMSYSSHSSAGYANNSSPRGSMRRSNSYGSYRSAGSHHSAHSSGSQQQRRQRRAPQVGHHDTSPAGGVNTLPQNQEQFVCGMEFGEPGMFYTGQIHVQSRLPHGLGTLRSECDKTMFEGEWHFGVLIQESGGVQGHQEEEEEEEYDDYCLPCTDGQAPSSLSNSFQRQCNVSGLEDCEEENSSFSNSMADTIHDEDTESQSSWSRTSSSSRSQNSGYSARESKKCLPPSRGPMTHGPSSTSRATNNKLQEYERYVEQCDTEEDWYSNSDGSGSRASLTSYNEQCSGVGGGGGVLTNNNDYDRPKRVRFREDP